MYVFQSGLTPLHVASFMGCMNIVIYLLQHNANPDVPTVRGETPLHLAARANQTDIIRILLRNGAQVDAKARVSSILSILPHLVEDVFFDATLYCFVI
jgi:ankyrin repeat protein